MRFQLAKVWLTNLLYRFVKPSVQLSTTVIVVEVVSSIKVFTTNR